MLDKDLADIYSVELKRLNEQVKRNSERFPGNFMFQLTKDENEKLVLRSQIATLKKEDKRGIHRKYLPYVFTEQGVSMLSAVLKSNIFPPPLIIYSSPAISRGFGGEECRMVENQARQKDLPAWVKPFTD